MLVLALNLRTEWLFAQQMAVPRLRVERWLLELRRLERLPRITSLNMRIENFWSRLWANAFLLRKAQYFVTHSYEGRLNTGLKGEWDLSDSLLRSLPARAEDFVNVNPQFHVVRVKAPGLVKLAFGEGWHPLERQGISRWRWSSGPAGVTVSNPSPRPVAVTLALRVRSLESCRLQLELGAEQLGASRVLDGHLQRLVYSDVRLPPGESVLTLRIDRPAARAAEGDPRPLAVALYRMTVQARP